MSGVRVPPPLLGWLAYSGKLPHYDAQALVLQGLVSFLAGRCDSLRVGAALHFASKVRRILRRLLLPGERLAGAAPAGEDGGC